ncbi:MAG TPA: LPS export ABC transporter permease LptG [Gammaproteobacteria bacterium]|nr:LPS export ABC transporter permease LptG [Gammaproteobacteria bacterium]
MKQLDRYIGRAVVAGTLTALLVLVSIDTFFTFMGELADVGKGSYALPQVMEYVALNVPRSVYNLFPTAALLGSLFSLGQLASHSELVAIRSAGVSIGRIARSVLQVGLVMLLLVSAMGEYVAAPAQQYSERARAMAQSERITFHGRFGFWARDGNQFINIKQILPGGILSGIYVYRFDGAHRLEVATHARRAVYEDGRWELKDVRQSKVSAGGVSVHRSKTMDWHSLLSPDLLNVVAVHPDNLSIRDLRRYIAYLHQNGLDAARYQLEFWMRMAEPLSALVMLFLSLPFVFGPLRSAAAGQRLVVGVLVGIGYYLISQTVSHLGQVYGFDPMLSALAPPLAFFLAGVAAVWRIR